VSSRPNSPSQKINTKHVSKRPTRLNKAQQRALEVRSAETRWEEPRPIDPVVADARGAAIAPPSAAPRTRRRAVQQGIYRLSRAQEMTFIRSDMRRLLIIAGTLLFLMLILLVIVE
jgi:hypothetical protein